MISNEVPSDCQAQAVVGDDIELLDVVVGFAGHYRMDAAGVVADHAAQRAAVVRGGIRGESQVMFFSGVAESIEHDPGLNPGDAAGRSNLENLSHCLAEID